VKSPNPPRHSSDVVDRLAVGFHFAGHLRQVAVLLEAECLADRGVAVGKIVRDAQSVGVDRLPIETLNSVSWRDPCAGDVQIERIRIFDRAAVFTSSSGLPSASDFFSCQLRTLAPWLLKVILNRSVLMTKGGCACAWVTGAVGAALLLGRLRSFGAAVGGTGRRPAPACVDFFALRGGCAT
jgi:hypothetical protein